MTENYASSQKLQSFTAFHQRFFPISFPEKIKRLESLLTKCKDSIKANKQKTQALTEVKESLSAQLSEREAECEAARAKLKEFEDRSSKAREEEIQIAETKMVMHQVSCFIQCLRTRMQV